MKLHTLKNYSLLIALLGAFYVTSSNAQDKTSESAAVSSASAEVSTVSEMRPNPDPVEPVAPAADDVASAPAADVAASESVATPMTQPTLVASSTTVAGDTAWMLTATALVLLMTIPGLALFYTGMVRKKNALGTIAHSFITTCIATILWVVVGYSLAFTPGSPFIGSLDRVMLHGMHFFKEAGQLTVSHIAQTIPESVFLMYQMTFAIITPALITGAFAERLKFSALILFVALWSLVVYVPVAHWVWEPTGWMAAMGILDFAGGTVVHINAGISGLVAALVIGPRLGFGKEPMPPHNLVLTVIGGSLLWVGWFGFNAGSAVAADGRAGMAMLVTQLATAVSAMAWMFAEWIARGKPSVLGMVSGAIAGLVAITPASGFVDVTGAFVIGGVAGVACYWGATTLKSWGKYDDSLDVFGVHAVGGIVGALLTGVFAVKTIGGVEGDIGKQAIGVVATLLYSGVMTWIILKLVNLIVGLRVSPEQERDGLDLALHGEHIV
jgi:ammonium transporter, Amt family